MVCLLPRRQRAGATRLTPTSSFPLPTRPRSGGTMLTVAAAQLPRWGRRSVGAPWQLGCPACARERRRLEQTGRHDAGTLGWLISCPSPPLQWVLLRSLARSLTVLSGSLLHPCLSLSRSLSLSLSLSRSISLSLSLTKGCLLGRGPCSIQQSLQGWRRCQHPGRGGGGQHPGRQAGRCGCLAGRQHGVAGIQLVPPRAACQRSSGTNTLRGR